MNSNNIIVQEYLSTLKEDRELDYLFPILLNAMGFRIVQTAKEAKGQSQYGKDIIAIGKDEEGTTYRWYFELKGYEDRDITDKNLYKTDGVRESIIEAKYAAFNDSSITGFNDLPIKIVVVHNGVLRANIRPTFDGFIEKTFQKGQFERWDIYYLTDLFSEYLFSEYLLADKESNALFKKTLAFLDTPDYNFNDLKRLVDIQIEKAEGEMKGRIFSKLFATLNLLEQLIFHYSNQNDNLIAAKECSKYIVIRTWAWILSRRAEKRKAVLHEFRKLLITQHDIFQAYFEKTLPVARMENGLFAENSAFFEAIGYPLRCFEYLEDIIYFYRMSAYYPSFEQESEDILNIRNEQKDLLIELITNNSGFYRPLLDNHSIAMVQLFLFMFFRPDLRVKDMQFIGHYFGLTLSNIIINKMKHNRLPELHTNIDALVESVATGEKSEEYNDSSSVLIAIILEIAAVFDSSDMFEEIKKHLTKDLSLQIPYPNFAENDIEQLLFEKHLHYDYHVECIDPLPPTFEEFKNKVQAYELENVSYRTDTAGFPFLRYLAHSYFKNELSPTEWRNFLNSH